MPPVHIQYRLTKQDFLKGVSAMWEQKKQSTRTHLVWGMAGLAAGVALYILLAPWAGIVAGGVGGLLLLLAALRPMLFGLAFEKTPEYGRGLSMFFEDEGVAMESKEKRSLLPWSKIDRLTPTGDFLFLYLKSRNFIVIPASAFPDQEAIEQVEALVRDKTA